MKIVNFQFKELHVPEAISLPLHGFNLVVGPFQGAEQIAQIYKLRWEGLGEARFTRATHLVITVSGHHSKKGGERAVQRHKEQLVPLGVSLNSEKTQMVDLLNGESFGFLGFDFRRVLNRQRTGYFILMTPKKKARKAIKAKILEIIKRGGASPAKEIIARINVALVGWVNYFRVGNSNRAFSEVRDYLEMKVRNLLSRRKRRK